jgi:flagellar protein FliS
MTAPRRVLGAYSRAAETTAPLTQIVMLYDGVIHRLHEMRAAVEAGEIERRFALTQRIAAIIGGLQAALDHERGGEVAPLLDRFYGFALWRLNQINLRNDPTLCDELVARFTELRASWAVLAGDSPPPAPRATRSEQAPARLSA